MIDSSFNFTFFYYFSCKGLFQLLNSWFSNNKEKLRRAADSIFCIQSFSWVSLFYSVSQLPRFPFCFRVNFTVLRKNYNGGNKGNQSIWFYNVTFLFYNENIFIHPKKENHIWSQMIISLQ